MLTLERLKEVLHYDPVTGVFTHLTHEIRAEFLRTDLTWNTRYAGKEAGTISKERGYRRIGVDGKKYQAHALAWLYMTGRQAVEVDHRNLNGSDNRWENLRECSRSQNQANVRAMKNNSHGVKGVYWNKKGCKWEAHIGFNYSRFYLGAFDDKEDAVSAYAIAAKKYFGEFARLS